jgi:hypothetical protein
MSQFVKNLKLEVLPAPQKEIWTQLNQIPSEFTLYGGTAIALYLGHRESVDFDFFCFNNIDVEKIQQDIPLLKNAKILQKERNALTCLVNISGFVQISFFGLPQLKQIFPSLVVSENSIKIASLLDLGGMKAVTVQHRAEFKDYIDIYTLLKVTNINLSSMLKMGLEIYGSNFNPQISLKALSFFEDGDLSRLTSLQKKEIVAEVKKVNLDKLPHHSDLQNQLNELNKRFLI